MEVREGMSNLQRRDYKQVIINFVQYFTNIKIKRLSTFGLRNGLLWISDYFNPNTSLIVISNRGYMHMVSDFNIIHTLKQ